MKNNKLEISNYWDDFQIRVNDTIDTLNAGKLPSLQRLTVHITESCNMKCGYCNMHFQSKEIDFKLLKKIIDDYSDMNGKTIHFTGGEPTVYKYFEEACAYAKSKGLTVTSNTNGLKRVDTSNIDKFKTSFDTCYSDKFDKMVGTKSFDKVVENMKIYSKELDKKMISITAVLNKNTYKDMLALVQFVEENFNVYNLYFSNYKGNDPEYAFTDDEIDDMFENYIPAVLDFFKKTGNTYSHKQLELYKPHDFVNKKERFEINKTLPCTIQLSEMTIDIDGNCHNCSHLFRDGVRPDENINVNNMSLKDCFHKIKSNLGGNYTCLDDFCLSGCNTNLIGFNQTVANGDKFDL
jgi:MoaA/NifB/PqqE/SkfB family radical SAM enzyme